jgi:hypothetical protein
MLSIPCPTKLPSLGPNRAEHGSGLLSIAVRTVSWVSAPKHGIDNRTGNNRRFGSFMKGKKIRWRETAMLDFRIEKKEERFVSLCLQRNDVP